jgi:hypothetical protein
MRGDGVSADCNVAKLRWQPATDNNCIIFRVCLILGIAGCIVVT